MARFMYAVLIGWAFFGASALAGELGIDDAGDKGLPSPAAIAQRDQKLHATAVDLAGKRDAVAAMRALAAVKTPRVLAQAIGDVHTTLADNAAATGGSNGGHGGAMIDFGPLVNLIQTTIAPDTWQETVGGPSTIAPYAAGIVVDPNGLITDVAVTTDRSGLLENIAVMLARDHRQEFEFATQGAMVDAWRLPSELRCVSLRSVAKQIAKRRLSGQPVGDELRHLAGLSRIRFVVIDQENEDVLLLGKVGGIESRDGWVRDSRSGAVTIRIDQLAACFATVISRQPMGCSIDPTAQALKQAAEVSTAIRRSEIAPGVADAALREALGDQVVRVFGVAGDTSIAHLMVHADRHMKRLSLGLEPMPRGVENYLDVVARYMRNGPPDGQLLRLWFAGQAAPVRQSSDGLTFELGGRSMMLQSETQRAGIAGERLAAADDVRLVEFVSGFNRNLDAIASHYPAYAALETVYHSAAIAELIHRTDAKPNLNRWLGPLLMDDPAAGTLHAPKRVASIAVGQAIRQGSKKHFVLLASGGVVVRSADLIAEKSEIYPSLDNFAVPPSQPRAAGQWWWDIKR
jgi:hypothetical protein